MKYMMTCGHNSDDENECPFGCPDSKKLFEVGVESEEKPEIEVEPEEAIEPW